MVPKVSTATPRGKRKRAAPPAPSALPGVPGKPDSDEMENISEEDRLYKPITIDGVVAPYVIDHYRNGTQTSRINYESVEFNKPIADSLFAKPASIKAVK